MAKWKYTDEWRENIETNYGLDYQSPAEAMRWWAKNGGAPAGAVAALGCALQEIDRLRAEDEELKHDIARHVAICAEQAMEIERLTREVAGWKSTAEARIHPSIVEAVRADREKLRELLTRPDTTMKPHSDTGCT